MTTARRYSYADLNALPYDEWNQYEIIDGELYVSRRGFIPHQWACGEVMYPLHAWSESARNGLAFPSLSVVFSDHDVVIPDLIWISFDRMRQGVNDNGHVTVAPELVAEVLSPGSEHERRDREIKLALYSRQGVGEYWIVDVRSREILVYRQGEGGLQLSRTLGGDDVLESPQLPGFSFAITRLRPPSWLLDCGYHLYGA